MEREQNILSLKKADDENTRLTNVLVNQNEKTENKSKQIEDLRR